MVKRNDNNGTEFVYVFNDTEIADKNGQEAEFSDIEVGTTLLVKGGRGEGQVSAKELKIVN
ncbi:MAG: hypothetical protein NUV69_02360 [Candidatus Curtissbacteria bacterium]|nr:hypothetical protein [Candidatus Curtissbacteria bacterium]